MDTKHDSPQPRVVDLLRVELTHMEAKLDVMLADTAEIKRLLTSIEGYVDAMRAEFVRRRPNSNPDEGTLQH